MYIVPRSIGYTSEIKSVDLATGIFVSGQQLIKVMQ
jgi:hypothetical protein